MPVNEPITEYITINGIEETKYEVTSCQTAIGSISFSMQGNAATLRETFKKAVSLKVYPNNEEGTEAYGIYPNVSFESNTELEDNNVRITLHILTDQEIDMRDLKKQVNDHEEILATMMFGGEE